MVRLTPRKYSMDKRRAASEETRRRIVEATLALHAEKGIFGTSWKDIAERADVSVATVYNHFPSLDELVPACGELVYAITRPPSLEDAPRIFAGARTLEERLECLVSELFDFYERGAPYLEVDFQERQLPAVQEWEAHMRATIEGLVREALRPLQPDDGTVRAVGALLDFPVFMSFRRHEIPREQAEEIMNHMLVRWLEGARDDL
jgi:AcrR family transcriptional regulator